MGVLGVACALGGRLGGGMAVWPPGVRVRCVVGPFEGRAPCPFFFYAVLDVSTSRGCW